MADWEEVKRLAADFQRAQLSSTVQKLSERNCIEIVSKLVEQNLLDIIYTTDGKEYLTHQEVSKEIREELQVHGGRINLVELQTILNIDFSHIESKVNELVKNDKSLRLVLGQLIERSYVDGLVEEINDKLHETGQITVAELTKLYDLPATFLSEVVQDYIGKGIDGRLDEANRGVIFTESFVARHRSKIRGAFSAVTKPTPLMTVINRLQLQERLFYSILEELVKGGRLAGAINGGRNDKSTYIPDIYSKTQNDWVSSFYNQNGYLEYDAMARLGITDAKSYIKKNFKKENVVYLSTCCVGKMLQDQMEAQLDEALSSSGWVDAQPFLPSILSEKDANQLINSTLKSKPGLLIFCDTIVATEKFIAECRKPFDKIMAEKAEKDARTNPALFTQASMKDAGLEDTAMGKQDRKDQRKKKAATSTKSGGGTQGREVKQKATKNKYKRRGDHDDDSEDEAVAVQPKGRRNEIPFMTNDEIQDVLQKGNDTLPDDMAAEIAQQLHRPLTKEYQEIAKSVFLQTSGSATGTARKKTHGELQDKIGGLWTNAKLFEKGIKLFNEETQTQLSKHMLKTICSDITNLAFGTIATQNMMSVSEDTQMNADVRIKLLSKLPENSKSVLSKLHTSLSGKSLEDFFNCLDTVCGQGHLELFLKKPDKKKERQLVFNHRLALAEQLRNEYEPAMALHLASVIIFQTYTQCMVHAPGKVVPQIITFLDQQMTNKEQHEMLVKYQDLVVEQMKKQGEDSEDKDIENIKHELNELLPKIKEIALTAKKSNAQAAED